MDERLKKLAEIKNNLICKEILKKNPPGQKVAPHSPHTSKFSASERQHRNVEFPANKKLHKDGSENKRRIPNDFYFPGMLTRVEEFKQPDDWVSCGKILDYLGNKNGRTLSIRLGLDFGTVYAKVAYKLADKVFFVKWNGIRNTNGDESFFLPCEMSETENKTIVLGRYSEQSNVFNNLKEPFLKDNPGENFSLIIIFIAWIFRYVRAWIYKEHKDIIAERKIVYQINFGKPSNKFSWKHDDIYKKIVTSAWYLSQLNEKDYTVQNAEHIFKQNIISRNISLEQFDLIPEFAAQIAGYAQSPQRVDGLHMFFDIGGGTIDVSLFNIYRHPEREEIIPIFSCEVSPLGTHFLMQQRIANIVNNRKQIVWSAHHASMSSDAFANHFGCDPHAIRRCDDKFSKDIMFVLTRNIHITKCSRYPLAPEWRNGLRTFMSGGGKRCELYQNAIQEVFKEKQLRLFNMKDQYFDYFSREDNELRKNSHRLSVAYGLTFDPNIIGKIEFPDDVAPLKESTPRDRDDIYT